MFNWLMTGKKELIIEELEKILEHSDTLWDEYRTECFLSQTCTDQEIGWPELTLNEQLGILSKYIFEYLNLN